jgi:histidyl-tRNA synthetase
MQLLRGRGIRSELFHENQKIDRQYKYAENKNIPYVASVDGAAVQIKDIRSGEVKKISADELLEYGFE